MDVRRQATEDALRAHAPEDRILVGWVVVCDWADGDGDRWLEVAHSEGMPTWQRDGMLYQTMHDNQWPVRDED
jgi:hypothetical protein